MRAGNSKAADLPTGIAIAHALLGQGLLFGDVLSAGRDAREWVFHSMPSRRTAPVTPESRYSLRDKQYSTSVDVCYVCSCPRGQRRCCIPQGQCVLTSTESSVLHTLDLVKMPTGIEYSGLTNSVSPSLRVAALPAAALPDFGKQAPSPWRHLVDAHEHPQKS
jgi:hypothetical protein